MFEDYMTDSDKLVTLVTAALHQIIEAWTIIEPFTLPKLSLECASTKSRLKTLTKMQTMSFRSRAVQ